MSAESSNAALAPYTVEGKAGDVIFRAGDAGRELFLILDGQVELVAEPASIVVATCGAGDVLGERGAFGDAPREHTARATASFRALRFDRDTVAKIGVEDSGVLLHILERVSTRTSTLNAPSTTPVPARAIQGAVFVVAPGDHTLMLPNIDESWVGRRDTANGFNPEIDLTDIDTDRSLSRRHARVLRRDGRVFVVEASGARNGTFVNGQRLGDAEAELANGDRVRFGLVDTVFRVTET